jgi:hypothetical protein
MATHTFPEPPPHEHRQLAPPRVWIELVDDAGEIHRLPLTWTESRVLRIALRHVGVDNAKTARTFAGMTYNPRAAVAIVARACRTMATFVRAGRVRDVSPTVAAWRREHGAVPEGSFECLPPRAVAR